MNEEKCTKDAVVNIRFRITGIGAIERINSVIEKYCSLGEKLVHWEPAEKSDELLDFVYETNVCKVWYQAHRSAKVLNRLYGTAILEDKANFTLISRHVSAPMLECHIAKGKDGVIDWIKSRWNCDFMRKAEDQKHSSASYFDWWCVKASRSNGGGDIWVINPGNVALVVNQLQSHDVYVIQRYVLRPLILPCTSGAKSHFRMFAVIKGDLSSFLYSGACILCARRPYNLSDATDHSTHLTNLSLSKNDTTLENFLPQSSCNVQVYFPKLWPKMLTCWAAVVEAAKPFMGIQASPLHFEFLGLDFIADESENVWLLEVNRLPGLASTRQNLVADDTFYNALIVDLLKLVLIPLVIPRDVLAVDESNLNRFIKTNNSDEEAIFDSSQTWKNLIKLAVFAKRCKSKE